ncbi:membrane-spanning 4-domains subfamily A member 8-like isoform X5 [Phyllostomus hastatus]|uniref:membrane-spanning 4-domains subfamily A member 8-like isoform X5 n=1 Tax=Phyllostomus hastatus TaxID=9423 RepID=UPI001E681FAF|nr:membrane-spanning 4-domains subfamily A member 8-like isoform X5 [Phyllostomus hastatus]
MELLNLCTQDLRGYRIHTSMCKPSSCPEQWDLCKGTESYGNTHSSLAAPGTLNPVCFFFRKNKLPTTKHWGTGARETELQAEQQSTTQVTMYPHNQPQVNLIPGNQPGLQTPASPPPAQRSFKEGKTLGALQILIGLIHFGLGSILGTTQHVRYEPVSFIIGCAFWGGISFIISGSLSVASEEQPNSPCVTSGFATSGVLLIFSLLELFIASTCAHFGCQLVSYGTVVYQTIYVSNQVSNPEPVNSPPSYSREVQHSK